MTEFVREHVKQEDMIQTSDIAASVRFLLELSPAASCRRSCSSDPVRRLRR
jgi:hypothetical protein